MRFRCLAHLPAQYDPDESPVRLTCVIDQGAIDILTVRRAGRRIPSLPVAVFDELLDTAWELAEASGLLPERMLERCVA